MGNWRRTPQVLAGSEDRCGGKTKEPLGCGPWGCPGAGLASQAGPGSVSRGVTAPHSGDKGVLGVAAEATWCSARPWFLLPSVSS